MESSSHTPYLVGDAAVSQEFLTPLYPKDQWIKRKDYSLHFFLALGDPDERFIGIQLDNNPQAALLQDPVNSNLTPLHIAAMKANVSAASCIVKRSPDSLNLATNSGILPIHLAALTSEDLYQILKEAGANLQQKTKTGMTCEDLRRLSGRVTFVSSQDSLFYQADAAQPPVLLSSDSALKVEVFGKDFFHTDFTIFDPPFFLEVMKFRPESSKIFLEAFKAFLHKRPHLVIGPSIIEGELELKAKERIEAGSIIAEYTGKKIEIPYFKKFADNFSPEEVKNSGYRGFNFIDAKNVGNELRFANCGFPNAMTETIVVDGVERTVFIAFETIESGDPILIDYGMDMLFLIYGTQILYGKEKMIAFYKQFGNNILDHLAALEIKLKTLKKKKEPTILEMSEFIKTKSWFGFPIQNPTGLLFLHFHKIIDAIKFIHSLEYCSLEIPEDFISQVNYQHVLNIVRILDKIKNKYKGVAWDNIALWVNNRLEKIPLTHILKGLDLFSKGDGEEDINAVLANYDWLNDEDHPLSYSGRLENLFLTYSRYPKEEIIPQLLETLDEKDQEFESYQMAKELIQRLKAAHE